MMFLYPVYVLERGKENDLPQVGTYYVVTKNGIFLRKENGIFTAVVQVPGISFLGAVAPSLEAHIPKIPVEISALALSFFKAVYLLYGTEAVCILHYSKEKGEYALSCQEQIVDGSNIYRYERERLDGYSTIGTFHSHGGMSAFHSGIDVGDETYFDGIHVTFGNMGQNEFDVCCSWVVNGNRFPCDPVEVFEGIIEAPPRLIEPTVLREEGKEGFPFGVKLSARYLHRFFVDEDDYANRVDPEWLDNVYPLALPKPVPVPVLEEQTIEEFKENDQG